MACEITDGLGRQDCPPETPGVYDEFYLYNRSQVASYTPGPLNTVTDIVFNPGAGFYSIIGKKQSVVGRSDKQADSAADFTHQIDYHVEDLSNEAREHFMELVGANVGAIVRTKGGRFLLYGYNGGMELSVNNMSTAADALGYFATLEELQVNEHPRIFFDTDADITLANIVANIVGS